MKGFKEEIKGSLSWKFIEDMIQEKIGSEISNIYFDIKETGDHDLGTYGREIKKITFIIHKDRPYLGNFDVKE